MKNIKNVPSNLLCSLKIADSQSEIAFSQLLVAAKA